MSFLDLYQADQQQTAKIQPNEGTSLPSGFGENLRASWADGQMFSQSIARSNARAAVLGDYIDEIRQKTGNDLSKEFIPDVAGGGQTGVTDFDTANERVAKLKQSYPDLDLDPLSEDEIDKRAVAKSQAAHRAYEALQHGEKTWGGSFGSFIGSAGSAAADPVNILALAVAPETKGISILSSALKWGALGGVSQAVIEASSDSFKEQVQPGYTESGAAPAAEIGGAFLGGAILGGTTKALGNLWTKVKTGQWPTSVRDAGNVIESEANVANSNPFVGAEGEVAHREALTKSVDDILANRPVDVKGIVTPELLDKSRPRSQASLPVVAEDIGSAPHTGNQEWRIRDSAGGRIGGIEFDVEGDKTLIGQSAIDNTSDQGKGYGVKAYQQLADWSLGQGRELWSDVDVSQDAINIYKALERRGYKVEYGPYEKSGGQLVGEAPGTVRVTALPKQLDLPLDSPTSKNVADERIVGLSPEGFHDLLQERMKLAKIQADINAGKPALHLFGRDKDGRWGSYFATHNPDELEHEWALSTRYEPERKWVVAEITSKSTADENAQIDQIARNLEANERGNVAPRRPEISGPQPITQTPELIRETLTSPQHQDVIRGDIDRAIDANAAEGKPEIMVPGIDENGNHTMVGVNKAVDEVDAYKKLSDDIQACATMQEAAE